MSVMDKLKKNSKLKNTEVLSKSKFFTEKDMVPTEVPMVNVACLVLLMAVLLQV